MMDALGVKIPVSVEIAFYIALLHVVFQRDYSTDISGLPSPENAKLRLCHTYGQTRPPIDGKVQLGWLDYITATGK